MPQPLLATKLFFPSQRPKIVTRARLVEKLSVGLQPGKRLVLITAPAGYGKTTLLVDWIQAETQKKAKIPGAQSAAASSPIFCWLSLDAADNNPQRFLAYVIEALKGLLQEDLYQVTQTHLDAYSAAQAFSEQEFLIPLLNRLGLASKPFVLILDDYHVISEPGVHQVVQFLLNHQPLHMRLVLATRSDPPLSLARLRARDQLCEIRMNDLEFTPEEAAEFLTRVMGLDLAEADIDTLERRTEGWAAGLQMAALAIQSPTLASPAARLAFIHDFSGSHRHILEYLSEEVFNQQPESIQTFLMCTSVLDRMNASLCDAVLGRGENRHAGKEAWVAFSLPPTLSGQDLLEWLDHNNLFLIPLDTEHRWFRYHPLFADLLKTRLKRLHPGYMEELLKRASCWSEQQGLVAEAIGQALASNDFAFTASLLERQVLTFFYQGEITQVHCWLSALPVALLRGYPLLCAVYAAVIALLPPYPARSLAAAEPWMQMAEQALSGCAPEDRLARAFALKIRSYWARFLDQPADIVIGLIQSALAILPADVDTAPRNDFLFIRSALHTNHGLACWEAGDEQSARQIFFAACDMSRACNDLFNESKSINCLAKIHLLHGQLVEAAALCRKTIQYYESQRSQMGHRMPYSGEIGVQLGEILIEQNHLDGSEPILIENIELAGWTVSHKILIHGQLALARLEWARGNLADAFRYLDAVEKISNLGASLAGALRASLWLALRSENPEFFELARLWAQEWSLVEFQKGPPQMEWDISLALARLMLAEGEPSRLAALLDWLERQARAMQDRGWSHWELQLRVLEALARQAMGDQAGALVSLKCALASGEPGGYVRTFVEEGQPMRSLLRELDQSSAAFPYIRKVLAAFPAASPRPVNRPAPCNSLVEPLTEREIEVLRLICQGATNQEIADQLVVTLNTVKKHNYSIFQKLDVPNRAQAILAARSLGLEMPGPRRVGREDST